MERIRINKHVSYSRIVHGFWRLNEWGYSNQQLNDFLHEIVDRGITTMDHADIYGNYTCESLFGDALALTPNLREKLEIVTKCGIILPNENKPKNTGHRYDQSYEHIIESVDQSLLNLKTDYIDTLLIHRPSPLMDPDEMTRAVMHLVDQGKIKAFGVSNFKCNQYELLNESLKKEMSHISVNQVEVSPYQLENIEDCTLNRMLQHDVKVMAWSPLAGGKIFDANDEKSRRILEVIQPLASKYNVSVSTVVYSWLLKLPSNVMPIVGSSKIDRVDEAVKATKLQLTDQEWFDIYVASRGEDIL
ncbi:MULTISPECIES: aldo/keto reductase [Mammaliicoccus]|uniref:Aldo/keto reductase n=1 Tax=Mammaliicoccus fleurettii TaxID=150056 RepID=A0ABS5MMK7_9STAP|nr:MULTISPECIES: aldo/keto reductase [Mammaliicoccus]HCN61383.1 oxidoreductase [Staphylococcus sp.]MBL0847403.1 aldo/keto reductase [Mammaliicoccus fleurettii]MBO3063344.1 aldo/keto reductase [Mammaliicoccus fleurettii]MBS3672178.1 aldo/keto reductase [Mammaliicoccus fleurettii]MBS3697153.1 aldo/keto reductase [Mammaliicoccus fleurettii]